MEKQQQQQKLKGITSLITGGCSGIGLAICEKFASEGSNIIIFDIIDIEKIQVKLNELKKQYPTIETFGYSCNVANSIEVENAFNAAINKFGKITNIISNASFSERTTSITNTEWEGALKTFEVTQFGTFHILKAASKHLQSIEREKGAESHGKILVIGSIMGRFASVGAYAYAMSKAAIEHLVRCLAKEMTSFRVNVNSILPGWIFTLGELKFHTKEEIEEKGATLPWGRLGQDMEIANSALFLCSNDSDYITGTSLVVDGGYMCHLSLGGGTSQGRSNSQQQQQQQQIVEKEAVLLKKKKTTLKKEEGTMITYDLIIHSGNIIDPSNNINNEPYDIFILNGKIAKVCKPNENNNNNNNNNGDDKKEYKNARKLFNASGCIVTPGLIDSICISTLGRIACT